MNNVINFALISNPENWSVLFVIFTFWAFAAHLVEKSAQSNTDNQ